MDNLSLEKYFSNNYSQISVVSSDKQMHHVLASVINPRHYSLKSLFSGNKCLKNHFFDSILIIDLLINDIDSLSLIKQLKQKNSGLFIIAIMGKPILEFMEKNKDNIKKEAIENGADSVFIAPFNLAELVSTIECLAEKDLLYA